MGALSTVQVQSIAAKVREDVNQAVRQGHRFTELDRIAALGAGGVEAVNIHQQ